jgi:phage anti-repressor protein
MDELIKIGTDQEGKQTVNARDLHSFLGVGRDFTT